MAGALGDDRGTGRLAGSGRAHTWMGVGKGLEGRCRMGAQLRTRDLHRAGLVCPAASAAAAVSVTVARDGCFASLGTGGGHGRPAITPAQARSRVFIPHKWCIPRCVESGKEQNTAARSPFGLRSGRPSGGAGFSFSRHACPRLARQTGAIFLQQKARALVEDPIRDALTDAGAQVVQTYAADEYGLPTESQGSRRQPVQWAGEERDEQGLVFLRARSYEPATGRFLQADPLRQSGPGITGWNRYAYATNNPVTWVDPSGLCVDPGGPGIRYCIERYIPTETTRIPLPILDQIEFSGDNRGPSAEGGTFKLRQFISIRPDGTVDYLEDVGWTTGLGRHEQGVLGSCVAGVQVGTSGAAIAASCEGFIGVIGKFAPPIGSFFVIQQSASGKARILAASGTPYPSAEIWQYGGPNWVEQIYHFDPVDYGYTPLDLFVPRELPIQRNP